MTKLHQVHDLHGRGDLTGGRLDRLVAQGIRGVTSNPTIIAKAIGGSADYDGQLAAQGHDAEASYWALLFGLDRYEQIIEAYDGDLSGVHSAASFFVSRVDSEVGRRRQALGTPEALALKGKAAVAQAKLAYRLFRDRFGGPRWQAFAAWGAGVHRPLWASTKNPAFADSYGGLLSLLQAAQRRRAWHDRLDS